MTASEETKLAGLKNLKWLAEKFNVSTECLRVWHKDHPDRFKAFILYAVHKKDIGDW